MIIKEVLVPIDFSPPSRLALDHGIALARKCRARLVLLNVIEAFWSVTYTSREEIARIERQRRDQARRMLLALLTPEDSGEIDYKVLIQAGDIPQEIAATVREQNTDVIVIGTHGRGLVGRTLIGSVTRTVLRNSPVPIVTVCSAARPHAYDRIVFATDFSETCDRVFRFVLDFARMMQTHVAIVHAVDTSKPPAQGSTSVSVTELVEQAQLKLNGMAELGAREQIRITTVIEEGDAAEAIFKAAANAHADMIVIGVRKKRFLTRVIFGSVADRVIRKSYLPVLSIPTERVDAC